MSLINISGRASLEMQLHLCPSRLRNKSLVLNKIMLKILWLCFYVDTEKLAALVLLLDIFPWTPTWEDILVSYKNMFKYKYSLMFVLASDHSGQPSMTVVTMQVLSAAVNGVLRLKFVVQSYRTFIALMTP